MKPTTRWMQIVLLSLLSACGGGSDSTENNRSHQTIDLNSGIMQDSYPLTVILPEDYANQLTSSPTFALRVSGGGFPLLGDSCSRSTWFLLHRAA